jgi:hypothetical protein
MLAIIGVSLLTTRISELLWGGGGGGGTLYTTNPNYKFTVALRRTDLVMDFTRITL